METAAFGEETFLWRDDPRRTHALVAYSGAFAPSMVLVANLVASYLEEAGIVTDVADASVQAVPPPPDYELVVIGLSLKRFADHPILRWAERFSSVLTETPLALFALTRRHRGLARLRAISRTLGWQPLVVDLLPRTPDVSAIRVLVGSLTDLCSRREHEALDLGVLGR